MHFNYEDIGVFLFHLGNASISIALKVCSQLPSHML